MADKKILPKQTEFEKILKKINTLIFNGQLTDIIEVTYAYKKMSDWNYWNETLFGYFAGFRFDLWHDLSEVWKITERKLHDKIKLIDTYLEKIANIDSLKKDEKIRANILKWSLNYSRNCLEMALVWLSFELSKAWYYHNLDNKEIKKKITKIEKLEKKNFGWNISKNPREISLAYNFILKAFREWKHLLSQEEQKTFRSVYIGRIKWMLEPTRESYRVTYYCKDKFWPEIQEKLSQKITRKKYTQIFSTVLNDLLWLDFKIVHEERSSIYDGPWFLAFPSSSAYDHLTLRRIIELIGHEIEVHCVNYRMNQHLIGNFRWAWNLEKEEGFAMTVEEFLAWRKLNDITVTQHFVKVLASEIFDLDELEEFMKLYTKLIWKKYWFEAILRQKRNYPLDQKWGQHKDVTYGRGIQKVLEFLKNWWDMRELYLWKISLEDIPKAKKLLKYAWKDISDLNIPIFFWELLLYLVITDHKKTNCDHFMKMLKKKYYFVNFENLNLLIVKEFVRVKVSFSSLGLV